MNKNTIHMPKKSFVDRLLFKIFKKHRKTIIPDVKIKNGIYSNIYAKKEGIISYLKRVRKEKNSKC